MTTLTDLEKRLRRGLQAAGDALPAGSHEPPDPTGDDGDGNHHPSPRGFARHRRVVGAAALVIAGGLVSAAVVAQRGSDGERPAVRSGAETTEPPTTTEPHVPRPTNGMVPGEAVIVGNQLRTYAPDGTQTGAVDLARFTDVQSASSDLDGGWVVCGGRELTPAEREERRREILAEIVPEGASEDEIEAETGLRVAEIQAPTSLDQLVWFPADRDPVVLDDNAICMASSVRVVDSADGPMAVFGAMNPSAAAGAPRFVARAIVLATGEERELPVPGSNDLLRWTVTTDRLMTAGPDGFHLYDLGTGDELPMAALDVRDASDIVLAPDGASVAVIAGGATGATDVSVYDVASGAQRFTERLSMGAEGAQLSYDGTTLAYGNSYDRYDTVTVVDLASGARHTIEAHGTLL